MAAPARLLTTIAAGASGGPHEARAMPIDPSTVVQVNVNLSGPGLTRPGFGTPLVLSNTGNAWATPELVRSYTKGSYATDFPAGTVENAILGAIFAQPVPPVRAKVGKGSHKPTLVRTVLVQSAVDGATYTLRVWTGGVLWTASYTAGNVDTTTTIAAALVDQLTPSAWQNTHAYIVGDRVLNDTGKIYECITAGTSAGSGGPTGTGQNITDGTAHWKWIATPNFAAANSGGPTVTATGAATGAWFAIEPLASGDQAAVSNLMRLTDTSTDPGVATDLDALHLADPDWYELVLAFKSSAILSTPSTGAAAWCEANGKLLVACVSDTAAATTAYSGGTDVLHTLTGQAGTYTAPQWHPRDYEFLDACTAGYFLPIAPGGDNWRLKTLVGPTPVNITPTQQTNLDARRAGYYVVLGGQNVLGGAGAVVSTQYGFIDTRRNIDWYRTNLQVDLIDLEVQTNKLFNTIAGRRKVATTIAARNQAGITAGVISPDPLDPTNAQAPVMEPFTVSVPAPVAGTDPNFDATTRTLSGITTSWKLASPINAMVVTVNVSQ